MTRKHTYNALTDIKIKKIAKSGRYTDGKGLHLYVTKNLTKQWVLRLTVRGVRREIGLGGYPDVPLAEARKVRNRMRAEVRNGEDPITNRNDSKVQIPSFKEAAYKVLELNRPNWKNAKHADQWINTLKAYAFPVIGNRRVDDITPSHILDILEPIWLTKHETANRVRQRMAMIFTWARTKGFSKQNNPVEGIQLALPKYTKRVKHHSALAYDRLNAFILKLEASSQSANTQLAIKFLLLTVCRTKELRFAKWEEIDFERNRWILDATRMKNGIEHHVPLSEPAIMILKQAKILSGKSAYIFPSTMRWNKPMSENTMLKAVKAIGYKITVHGFRSTFRDWASETMNYPNDVTEMVLAHTNPNKAEAAYKRGDLFEKREKIMREWAEFVLKK